MDRLELKNQIAGALARADGFDPDSPPPTNPFAGIMDNVSYPPNFVRDKYASKAEAVLAVLEANGIPVGAP